MNDITKALLKDLQNDLDIIKAMNSNIEVVWRLEKLKETIDLTNKLIIKSIKQLKI